jgi:hypothetical protein
VYWRVGLSVIVTAWLLEGACAQETISIATMSTTSPLPPASAETSAFQADAGDNPTDSIDWHERVKAARQRHADWLACIAAKWLDCSPAPAPDPMEPLLNDKTLVKGDIVSTAHGLRVFHGQSNVPHSLADFE